MLVLKISGKEKPTTNNEYKIKTEVDKMKEKICVYGASQTGKEILPYLENLYEILFFVDGKQELWGKSINSYKICSPECLKDYPGVSVFIATKNMKTKSEIALNILKYGYRKIRSVDFSITTILPSEIKSKLNLEKTIDLGKFFGRDTSIKLRQLTFDTGGSGTLDYAFLRHLAQTFQLNYYLEAGTYIGESINVMADICKECYSISAPEGAPYHMSGWCKNYNRADYSGKLTYAPNIHSFYDNSQTFDYSVIKDNIDLFFIDADHSYEGVLADTRNIFDFKGENAFVVWHDFKDNHDFNANVVMAVHDALGEEFENVYVTNNNMCGIYIPKQYQDRFPLKPQQYSKGGELYVYDTNLSVGLVE